MNDPATDLCDSLPGRLREICEGTSGLPEQTRAGYIALWVKQGRLGPDALGLLHRDEPELPGTAKVAANYVKAQVSHTLNGRRTVPEEVAKARVSVCETVNDGRPCDSFRPSDRRCAESCCGCYVDVKATWADQDCPKKLWPPVVTD